MVADWTEALIQPRLIHPGIIAMKSESEKDPVQRERLVLRNLLKKHFDEQDLQDLCFDLQVDYENLANTSRKDSKIRELILYMEKRLLLADLVKVARSHRPQVDWPSFPEQTKSVSYSPAHGLTGSVYSPVPTGFTDLDRLLGGGLFNSCLHAIAGRPSMGRSSFALSTALVSAKRYGKTVATSASSCHWTQSMPIFSHMLVVPVYMKLSTS